MTNKERIIQLKAELFDLQVVKSQVNVDMEKRLAELNKLLAEEKKSENNPIH